MAQPLQQAAPGAWGSVEPGAAGVPWQAGMHPEMMMQVSSGLRPAGRGRGRTPAPGGLVPPTRCAGACTPSSASHRAAATIPLHAGHGSHAGGAHADGDGAHGAHGGAHGRPAARRHGGASAYADAGGCSPGRTLIKRLLQDTHLQQVRRRGGRGGGLGGGGAVGRRPRQAVVLTTHPAVRICLRHSAHRAATTTLQVAGGVMPLWRQVHICTRRARTALRAA